MLGTILLIIIALLALVLIIAAMKPDTFRVERSITIQAPPEKVFGLINDFHQWPAWSPWEKMDPAMQRLHSGFPSGKGAVYAWEGNKKVGRGRMEILDTLEPSRIVIQLDFFAPFEAHNTAEFTFAAAGSGTALTWAMFGPQPFVIKVMGLMFSMDKMVGKDFEAGLATLKALAEA
jgi:uncharacterized protein YndB with AHSA1/START domain